METLNEVGLSVAGSGALICWIYISAVILPKKTIPNPNIINKSVKHMKEPKRLRAYNYIVNIPLEITGCFIDDETIDMIVLRPAIN